MEGIIVPNSKGGLIALPASVRLSPITCHGNTASLFAEVSVTKRQNKLECLPLGRLNLTFASKVDVNKLGRLQVLPSRGVSWGPYYKTFYGRNLWIFVIS